MTSQASSSEQPVGQQSEDADAGDAGGASAFAAALAAEVEGGKAGEESGDNGGGGESGESRGKTKPKDLADLASRLGLEVSDLYEVAVPAGQGREPMTIGKIKDRFTEFASLEAERLGWSEQRVQQEAELTRARSEFQELLSVIPRDALLNKELLTRVAARVAERNKALDTQVATALGWQDQTVRDAQMGEIQGMLSGYGYSAAEVKAMRDPRLLKVLRDAARREQQVRKALESVKPVQRKPVPASNTRGAPANSGQPAGQRPSLRPSSGRERFSEALNRHR